MTEHSFQGISSLLFEEESVTYMSGTICYLCLRPLTSFSKKITSVSLQDSWRQYFRCAQNCAYSAGLVQPEPHLRWMDERGESDTN
jgi:hypothetical protein